jgi:mycothiol synthase
MENAAIDPAPPNLEGLTWRPVTPDDLPALAVLARACHAADGGLAFMIEPGTLKDRYFPDAPGAAVGAFAPDAGLVACASVHLMNDASPPKVAIVGQVLPGQRGRGLGTYLLRWSLVQAQALRAGAAGQPVLQIATESLTDSADRLYRLHHFESVFEALAMGRDLRQPLPDHPLPPGLTLTTWQPDVAAEFYQAWYAAFLERPGVPSWSAADYIERVTSNDLVPEWTLLARAAGVPAGFVIGTIDLTVTPPAGHLWQVGVVPTQRRRGLASALLIESMRRMQANGAPWADLTVHTDNPGAIQTYAQIGLATSGRRARYERKV